MEGRPPATLTVDSDIIPCDPAQGYGAASTVPTVCIPSPEYVMDLVKIAARLEEVSPNTAPLHLDNPCLVHVEQLVNQFDIALYPNFMLKIYKILSECSKECLDLKSSEAFGTSMRQLYEWKRMGTAVVGGQKGHGWDGEAAEEA